MSAFNGFPLFNCNEKIWKGIFGADKHGKSQELKDLLSMDVDNTVFTRKKNGQTPWTYEVHNFLAYSEDPEVYKTKWLDKWQPFNSVLTTLQEFVTSVPQGASNSTEAHFLPLARKVASYLEYVLMHCKESSADNDIWISAGMYVLIAFFLQNDTTAEPRFVCPPPEFNPVGTPIIVPDTEMHSPETESAQDVPTEQKPPRTPDNKLQTHCRMCKEEDLFYYEDRMLRWRQTADSFCKACLLLGGIGSICFCIVAALTSIFPAFGVELNGFLEGILLKLYPGLTADKDLVLQFSVSFILATAVICWIVRRTYRYKSIIALQEKEKGYRWIGYECMSCGATYYEKLNLDHLPDTKETFLSIKMTLTFLAIILCPTYFISRLVVEIGLTAPSVFVFSFFCTLILSIVLVRSLIFNRLMKELLRYYPGVLQ